MADIEFEVQAEFYLDVNIEPTQEVAQRVQIRDACHGAVAAMRSLLGPKVPFVGPGGAGFNPDQPIMTLTVAEAVKDGATLPGVIMKADVEEQLQQGLKQFELSATDVGGAVKDNWPAGVETNLSITGNMGLQFMLSPDDLPPALLGERYCNVKPYCYRYARVGFLQPAPPGGSSTPVSLTLRSSDLNVEAYWQMRFHMRPA
ncbi:MAG: hypothetical protein V3W41_02710 [Planctomycetota bacterium]